ncbi:myophilin-like [Convolutriloba macropyga]|uniref:myophilin-like n=1 Tax=Convolutriloba macropyga TaxID=536237 RepID=UPI003F520C0B
MASRPAGYGLTAELQEKKDAKYDPEMEKEVVEWMGVITGETLYVSGAQELQETLRDGVYLCNLINCIQDGSVKKINKSKMPFKQMENIGNFLDACAKFGVKQHDMFQTVDLYEGQNMSQVVNGIYALGRRAQKVGMPGIGPKEAEENKREFTDEQMRAGDGLIGLQMGSNKGATQAGQNFGKTRAVID